MASDRKTVAAEDRDFSSAIGGWLDPFAQDGATVATGADSDAEPLPFSEWCVIPVALAFVIGDMILQFWR
jgi:hypothetical protein